MSTTDTIRTALLELGNDEPTATAKAEDLTRRIEAADDPEVALEEVVDSLRRTAAFRAASQVLIADGDEPADVFRAEFVYVASVASQGGLPRARFLELAGEAFDAVAAAV